MQLGQVNNDILGQSKAKYQSMYVRPYTENFNNNNILFFRHFNSHSSGISSCEPLCTVHVN